MGTDYDFDLNREDITNSEFNKYPFETKVFPKDQTWLNYKGKFSLEMLYKRIYEWLVENDYVDIEEKKDKYEHFFFENRGAEGGVNEILMWWRSEKSSIKNKMFRLRIFLDFQILGLGSETIVENGQKFNVNYGELSVFLRPYLDVELGNKTNVSLLGDDVTPWNKSGFTKNLAGWFKNRMYKGEIELHREELYADINELYAIIKKFLQLNNFVGVRKDMHPERGVPQYKL